MDEERLIGCLYDCECIQRGKYLAIACNNFAQPTIPSRAEKKAELKAPINIKYGDILI
jgi:hypothetical protein